MFCPILGKIKPVALFCVRGKYANGKKIGVGTSATYILLSPAIILFLGMSFPFLTLM